MARIPEDLLNLAVSEPFELKGVGICVSCSLKENGYDNIVTREELSEKFMNKLITISGAWWIIKGIESHAAMNIPHEDVGFLIQQWGVWHQLPAETTITKYNRNEFKITKI